MACEGPLIAGIPPGCGGVGGRGPVVSLRSTTGYRLGSLRERWRLPPRYALAVANEPDRARRIFTGFEGIRLNAKPRPSARAT